MVNALMLFIIDFSYSHPVCNYSAPIWRTDSYKCYTCVITFHAVFSEKLIILYCFVWMLHVFSEKYVIFAEDKLRSAI